jgi:hypothetical protein
MKKIYTCFFALAIFISVTHSQTIRPEFPYTDGRVWSIAKYGNTIYIGGQFDSVKYSSGASYRRENLASFDATTGTILPWDPKMRNDYNLVSKLEAGNNVIYIAGFFSGLGDSVRPGLAAVDAVTGAVTSWKPPALNYTNVLQILAVGSKVYIAGTFGNSFKDGENILVLDVVTGQRIPPFSNRSNHVALSMALKDNTLYMGGIFTRLNSLPRYNIGAIDAGNGNVLPWNPSADNLVTALAIKDNTVYTGGAFTGFGYDSVNKTVAVQRKGVAALDATTGAVLPWDPEVEASTGSDNPAVSIFIIDGSNVYMAGTFFKVGGQPRNYIAMVDAVTAEVSSWNPNVNGSVRDILVDGNTVFVGGEFTSIAGQQRAYFAAVTAPNCLLDDTQAPSINNLSTSLTEIWPANKKMKDVWIDYTTSDNCQSAVSTQLSISSNELITNGDWKIIDNHHIQLKADRLGNGNGRIYTITLTATDQAGNKNSKTTTVVVPHDQGKNINVRSQEEVLTQNAELLVKAQLNPSHSYFTLTTQSTNTSQKINLRLYDINGRLLEVRNVATGQSVQMGKTLNAGVYLLEYSQAGTVKQIKLIKQ